MNDYIIIEYLPEYYPELNVFWVETGLGGSYRGDNEEIIESTIKYGGHLLIMLDNSGLIIGSSWLTNDKRRTYIHHFGIREGYRNRGFANYLLEHSLQLAIADGYQIKLEVHNDNYAALKLYSKYGFNNLGDYQVMIKRELEP